MAAPLNAKQLLPPLWGEQIELGNQSSSGDVGADSSHPPVSRKILSCFFFFFYLRFYKGWRGFKEKGQILSLPLKRRQQLGPAQRASRGKRIFMNSPSTPRASEEQILQGTRDSTTNHGAEGRLAVALQLLELLVLQLKDMQDN